ncbi:MAG TPA: hypothetical protein VHQ47_03720 [Phycisphaerae bacterium]|nr:hypothetical protein [Phycisphaerae bacterium]
MAEERIGETPPAAQEGADGGDFVEAGEREPRWPALVAIVTAGLVYGALPESLSVGPRWLLIVVIAALEIPTLIMHYRGAVHLSRVLGYVVSGILTMFVVWSVALLVAYLPGHRESAVAMLGSAASLWASNVITFALWYWRLDGGGPYCRERGPYRASEAAFLFPQLTLREGGRHGGKRKWSPVFVDYLFVAFNTSTALSPTDSPVMARWAKVLTMVQSLVSLTVIALLLARAVNVM